MTAPILSRIAIVVPGYENGGGVPAVADFLADALERRGGFRMKFVSPTVRWTDPLCTRLLRPATWMSAPSSEEVSVRGRRVTRVGARWAEVEFMRYRPRQVLDAAVADADLVQVVCGSAVTAFALRRVRQPLFIQVATSLRVEREQGQRSGAAGFLSKAMTRLCEPMERAALRRADGVFVENRWMYERLQRELAPGRVHFAPPGVDTEFFRPDPAVSRDRLLFVGRLGDPRKNVKLLLEAYRRVRSLVPQAPPLVLAGATALVAADSRFIKENGLSAHIEICEAPDRGALAALYRRCRVFLLGSHEEGFGLVLAEAMASGAPVVSTDCGGPRSIVEDGINGFLVPPGAVEAMTERVVRLLRDDDLRRRLAAAARPHVVQNFSLDVCGRRFTDVYRGVRARPGSSN